MRIEDSFARSTYQQRCAKDEEEEYGARNVTVVHDIAVYPAKGVQDRKCLWRCQHHSMGLFQPTDLHLDVAKVHSELFYCRLSASRWYT